MNDRFVVGKIVNTHALKGELKVKSNTQNREDFEEFKYLIIEGEGDKKFEVSSIRYVKDMVLVKFKGLDNINDVEKYKTKDVYYLREDYNDLDDGEYYIVDLVGSELIDEKLGTVGTLLEVINNSAHDIYVFNRADGQGKAMIPAVDEYIINVDIDEKKIYVKLIEGMY